MFKKDKASNFLPFYPAIEVFNNMSIHIFHQVLKMFFTKTSSNVVLCNFLCRLVSLLYLRSINFQKTNRNTKHKMCSWNHTQTTLQCHRQPHRRHHRWPARWPTGWRPGTSRHHSSPAACRRQACTACACGDALSDRCCCCGSGSRRRSPGSRCCRNRSRSRRRSASCGWTRRTEGGGSRERVWKIGPMK